MRSPLPRSKSAILLKTKENQHCGREVDCTHPGAEILEIFSNRSSRSCGAYAWLYRHLMWPANQRCLERRHRKMVLMKSTSSPYATGCILRTAPTSVVHPLASNRACY